jgi:hypothetical protein
MSDFKIADFNIADFKITDSNSLSKGFLRSTSQIATERFFIRSGTSSQLDSICFSTSQKSRMFYPNVPALQPEQQKGRNVSKRI